MRRGVNAARDDLATDLRFGPMAQFMRGGFDEAARMAVAGSVADDLLASGWIAETRQQPRCGECNTCPCQAPASVPEETDRVR